MNVPTLSFNFYDELTPPSLLASHLSHHSFPANQSSPLPFCLLPSLTLRLVTSSSSLPCSSAPLPSFLTLPAYSPSGVARDKCLL
ncbi:hypothetical protein E2C01_080494 [Portunus trituberculatus]|uniref:Uncharacterized protein n=1 Tax=Portunus trituberculatus TaxID=210409 RepID=A0A5B7IU84_PORTR|nr:hypothetical protein [Portunus trituberculatus]